jgi:hypothetical protein
MAHNGKRHACAKSRKQKSQPVRVGLLCFFFLSFFLSSLSSFSTGLLVPNDTALSRFAWATTAMNKFLRCLPRVFGGWYKFRTCDPCRVKAVLYH